MTRILLAMLFLGACTPPDDEDIVVDEGKEDDFFAANATEYWVKGEGTITLEENLRSAPAAQKLARAKQLVVLKNLALGWFLNQYIIEKDDTDKNRDYGGWGGLVRFSLADDLPAEP